MCVLMSWLDPSKKIKKSERWKEEKKKLLNVGM